VISIRLFGFTKAWPPKLAELRWLGDSRPDALNRMRIAGADSTLVRPAVGAGFPNGC
jgi:hypothetical protein